ncbi:hypothetical protein L914_07540 [Phytophthora nicotianae]|uniref:Uncharacterized protein n=1 Tax=Phytophthora nicotianae TaxID=4792 RepID=W2NH35_PHYNI|nr:hypothetical protein L914_07540 [Phytophthora nicotianae]
MLKHERQVNVCSDNVVDATRSARTTVLVARISHCSHLLVFVAKIPTPVLQ